MVAFEALARSPAIAVLCAARAAVTIETTPHPANKQTLKNCLITSPFPYPPVSPIALGAGPTLPACASTRVLLLGRNDENDHRSVLDFDRVFHKEPRLKPQRLSQA